MNSDPAKDYCESSSPLKIDWLHLVTRVGYAGAPARPLEPSVNY